MFKKYADKTDGAIRGFDVKSTGVKLICIFVVIVCIFFAIVALFPSIWVLLAGFKDLKEFNREATILPNNWKIDGFIDTWDKLSIGINYLNSLIVVVGAVICSVIFNGLTAYGLSVLKPRFSGIFDKLVLLSMLIPSTTSVVALFVSIKNIGLIGSFIPLWFAFGANSFYIILFKQFFQGIPKEIIEAAQIDGCSSFMMFFKIILPLAKPIIMVIVIFTATAAWSDFLLPYLVLNGEPDKQTVMVRLFTYQTSGRTNFINQIRAIFFAIVPPTIIFIIFQKQIMDGAADGAVKG